MSSALVATLFGILGTGLAILSAACLLLWRRVRAPAPIAPGDGPSSRARPEIARRLDELAARHRALEARLDRIEATTGAAIARAPDPTGPRPGRRADRGGASVPGGPTLIAVPNLAAPPSAASEAASELDRRFGAVWALADSGASAEAVARATGYPIGQVELILGLRQLAAAEAAPDA